MPLPLALFAGAAIAGSVVSGASSIFGGKKRRRAANENARILEEDARALRGIYDLRAKTLLQDAEDSLAISKANAELSNKDAFEVNRVAQVNARAYEEDARASLEAAEVASMRQQLADRKILGDQQVSYAASGLTLQGSPLLAIRNSMKIAEQNANNIYRTGIQRSNKLLAQAGEERLAGGARARRFLNEGQIIARMGQITKQRYESQADIERLVGKREADNLVKQASLTRIQGRQLAREGLMGGISTILGGVGSVGLAVKR